MRNGLALCKIHHAAYDSRILGVSPDLVVQIRADILDETDGPLLEGVALEAGIYELVFCAGDYLRGTGQAGEGILFLDEIPIRFGVPDAGQHYHVPLLISPFAYSTYRGS